MRFSGKINGTRVIGVLLLLGFGAAAFFFWGSYIQKSKRCVTPVEAQVIRMLEHESDDGSTYSPVYEFTFNGQSYEANGEFSSNMERYRVGDSVTLHINPDDPNEFTDPKRDKKLLIIISGFFVIFAGVGVWLTVKPE